MLEAITRPVRRPRAVGNAESGLVRILVLPIWRLRSAPENEQLYGPVSPMIRTSGRWPSVSASES